MHNRIWHSVRFVVVAAFMACVAAAWPQQARADVTDDQILAAIKKQIDYLLSQKEIDNWEPQEKSLAGAKWAITGGQSGLVLYALLSAGRSVDDARLLAKSPELQPALKWLANIKPNPFSTYAAAMQLCALAQIPDAIHNPEYKDALNKTATFLQNAMRDNGEYSYFWDYQFPNKPLNFDGSRGASEDNSNGQYALLAVWEAKEAGVEINPSYWTRVNAHWRNTQDADGGWGYHSASRPYLNMTTAGLASLYITAECTDIDPPRLAGRPDPGINKGLEWVTEHFKANIDAYGLYNCERVGLASGLKYFGTNNWYESGAAAIIAAQNDDGSNTLHVEYVQKTNPIPATAYALLFLCRGRNPAFFNKLEYHDPKDTDRLLWNARPRDLANLTYQYSKVLGKDFNWHIVNLQMKPEDWLDSPVLLITGSRDPHFTAEDIAKFKTFVNASGTIFSTADGATPEFTAAMKKYASQIVDGLHEMRELPKDHPIYHLKYEIVNPPQMLGVSNGTREIWIHSPTDLGTSWQSKAWLRTMDWNIPANIYLYAVGKHVAE